MKILAVGKNYPLHVKELHSDNKTDENALLPKEPVIFSKPDSAIIQPGKPFFVPDFAERFDYEAELVVRISRVGKDICERFAHRYYDELTVGIDFTARDLQSRLTAAGHPWEICKGFDGSAGVGRFVPKSEVCKVLAKTDKDIIYDLQSLQFRLDMNGTTVQQGNTADMLFGVDRIISYASRFFTLKTGDLIFTGTPVGVGPVKEGDVLDAYLENLHLLHLRIK